MKTDKKMNVVNLLNLPNVSSVEDTYTPEPFDIVKHRSPDEIVTVANGVWKIKPKSRTSKAWPTGPWKFQEKDAKGNVVKEIPYFSYNMRNKAGEWKPLTLTTHPATYLQRLIDKHEATKNVPAEVLESWQD